MQLFRVLTERSPVNQVSTSPTEAAVEPRSAWEPLRQPAFRALWLATLVSNIGTWMHDVGAGWLMTTLSPSPTMVALVQTATTLPLFLLAMPAGALADIVDRRRYLIATQAWLALVASMLGVLTLSGMTSAWMLIAMTFAMGVGAALMMPAWAAVTPEIVARRDLQPAIALNSMAINVARAIGPALAGLVLSVAGSGPVFLLNAASYLVVIGVLYRWQRKVPRNDLPSERVLGAMRAGVRFAWNVPELHAAVIRGCAFFLFASASWALLPLVARGLTDGGPQAFGVLVGSIGAGAVCGALVLPRIRQRLPMDTLVAVATALYALAMLALASSDRLLPLCLAMAISGVAWIAVLSSLQVAAQLALPNWVRSRGLAVFMAAFMGSMALGSVVWGQVAQLSSIEHSLRFAAVGAAIAAVLTWRWKIGGIESVRLEPSMHWPTPIVHEGVVHDRGPVLVTLEYAVGNDRVAPFLQAMRELGRRRRRDGAYAWGVFQDTENRQRFIETFNVESWLEHLRQHQRVTEADRTLQDQIRVLSIDGAEPTVTHYLAADDEPAA